MGEGVREIEEWERALLVAGRDGERPGWNKTRVLGREIDWTNNGRRTTNTW